MVINPLKEYICNDCGAEILDSRDSIERVLSKAKGLMCPECGSKNISENTWSDAELLDEKDSKSSSKMSFFDKIIVGFIIVIVIVIGVFVLLFELIKDLASTIKLKKKSTPAPEVNCAEIVEKPKSSEPKTTEKKLELTPDINAMDLELDEMVENVKKFSKIKTFEDIEILIEEKRRE